jgi:flagellin-specific chaperone FliS
MADRKDLKFNQQTCTQEKFSELIPSDALGTAYQEGFTSFSIKKGKVLLSGRELNQRELSKGTTVPKVEKEQVEEMVKLSQEFKEDAREIFLLVTNNNSSIIYNGPNDIKILGYYDNDLFVFAGQDDQLKTRNDIRSMELAIAIFKRDGLVVVAGENGQPVTVVAKNSPYTYITDIFEKAREKIKNNMVNIADNKFNITDYQAFLYILSTCNYLETENILTKLTNEKKREKYQKIKENFYYFYTIISPDVLEGDEKLFLNYNQDLNQEELTFLKEKEDLPKTWRSVFAVVRNKYKSTQDIDIFKKLVDEPISKDVNMLAKVCRLCVKFDPKKHNLGERLGLA